jgi:cobalt-zinc-cadmium efflux system membrane fusion protein
MISARVLVAVPVSLCVALGAASCTRTQARGADTPAVTVEAASDADLITVDHPDRFPLVPVTMREAHPELQLPGVVSADVSRSVPVTPLAAGHVVELRAHLGDTVKKGELLLIMQSPDAAQARADLQKAEAEAALARHSLDRAHTLSDHEALAAKDLEAAVTSDQKAQADLRAAQERLRLLGGDVESASLPASSPASPPASRSAASGAASLASSSSSSSSPLIALRAPVSGTIIEQNVAGGAGVKSQDSSPNLFTIADLSRVWVLCDVYENNLRQVRIGDRATIRLNADPDRSLTARVSNVSRVLDPATRTAKVRLELSNADGLLRPGMFATVVFTSQQIEQRTVLPATAVVRLHDKDWVFVPDGASRFRRLEIRAGTVARNGVQQVLAGLHPGDRVVANALAISGASEQ